MKLKNGMIAIIDGTVSSTSKKWLDLEITNRWPMFGFGREEIVLLSPANEPEVISGYDHLSLPPDLRLHLSGTAGQIMFDASKARELRDRGIPGALHWFSVIGRPLDQTSYLAGPGKRRTWNQAVLISPFVDSYVVSSRTRVFVDFFLHVGQIEATAQTPPFVLPGMRAAFDATGCTFGPFQLRKLHRREQPSMKLLVTFRFGFVELDDTSAYYLYVSQPIHSRLPPREKPKSTSA